MAGLPNCTCCSCCGAEFAFCHLPRTCVDSGLASHLHSALALNQTCHASVHVATKVPDGLKGYLRSWFNDSSARLTRGLCALCSECKDASEQSVLWMAPKVLSVWHKSQHSASLAWPRGLLCSDASILH